MLILSRRINESIVIDGRIIIKILRVDRDTVKLGIQAPPEVTVHRQEIQDLIERGQANGSRSSHPPHPRADIPHTPHELDLPVRGISPGPK
ncbi:MAG: carbon storage regulator CsrA [Verrucomicrobia bacterium]|nr:carbon storage regulator CsrA [Verrucomicrobiota bacterium]